MKNIKNHLRKYLSVERRDLWDNSRIYCFNHLSVDTLKHKLKHIQKKDRNMKDALQEALLRRTKKVVENIHENRCEL